MTGTLKFRRPAQIPSLAFRTKQTTEPSTTPLQQTLEIATKRTANGRRYRIRVVEPSSNIGKNSESNSTESQSSSTTTKSISDNDDKPTEEPNHPENTRGQTLIDERVWLFDFIA